MFNHLIRSSFVRAEQGLTLIEILVTMVILSVGLLGLAGMQVNGLRSNQSAYLKTQASLLAADMADRMRLNSERAIAGDYNGFSSESNTSSIPSCTSSALGCSAVNQSALDKAEWVQQINGSGEVALLPDAVGTITRGAGNLFTITVQWSETEADANEGKSVATKSYDMNFSL